MKDITVATVQMNALCGETEENLARHDALARRAAKRGAELICFPELSITGHHADKAAWKFSEAVPGGPANRQIERLAKELGVVISAGIAERRNNLCYNTQFLTGPDGFIGKYSKTHASSDEYFYFRMGARFPVWDIGQCTVGVLICYDIILPEVARILAVNGAEVILTPHAARCGKTKSSEERSRIVRQLEFFGRIGWVRSFENGVFMVMNNQAGDAGGHLGLDVVHGGGMVVTEPGGDVVARSRSRSFREEVMVVKLRAQKFIENRFSRKPKPP